MNLFRSEEHARNWSDFNSDFEDSLQPLSYWLDRFSAEMFRARNREDYISWRAQQG